MKNGWNSAASITAIVLAALAVSGCQGAANNMATAPANNSATNAAAAPGGFNTVAAAPPTPAAPDPTTATGPLALPSDANLPAPCQQFIREAQACLDKLDPNDAQQSFQAGSVRAVVDSSRRGWPSAQDDSYRSRICQQELASFKQSRASRFRC
jgi:hypothetical protein